MVDRCYCWGCKREFVMVWIKYGCYLGFDIKLERFFVIC